MMQISTLPFLLLLLLSQLLQGNALSSLVDSLAPRISNQPLGNILILDHLNINHEQGRHDWLKAFYFEFMGCAVDPRKEENLMTGRKTLWANAGATQFHLPEGKPHAQRLDGIVTLAYENLNALPTRLNQVEEVLQGSQFRVVSQGESYWEVIDPWGTRFVLTRGDASERDARGKQPGDESHALGIRDLTLYAPRNIEGIARFYETVFDTPILDSSTDHCRLSVGPRQTLTFQKSSQANHVDLRDESLEHPELRDKPIFQSNYGPHVSMYVADLEKVYKQVQELGALYVNPRFKRRAYTLEEALEQCMFRCLDIVDPEDPTAGPILQLEHEIRSVVKKDGSKYKSCPFDEIPDSCRR